MSQRTLLVVEDHEDIRLAVRTNLRKVGRCLWADSAEKALEIMQGERHDIILMDIELPMMSGIELTKKLRAVKEYQGLAIIAFTASTRPGQRREALMSGCNGIILKPFTRKELIEGLSPYWNVS